MKIIALICIAALSLAGCTPTNVDDAIKKAAPEACSSISVVYTAFVASNYGSDKDKTTVDAAYKPISEICADPSTVTAAQLLIVAAQTAAIIQIVRKQKVNG